MVDDRCMSFQRIARRNRIHERGQQQSLCGKCLRSVDRADLEDHAGQLVCSLCRDSGRGAAMDDGPRQPLRSSPMTRALRGKSDYDAYERAGAMLEYGMLVVRCVLYVFFFLLAQRSQIASLALQGFLIADMAAWFVQLFFEVQRQPKNVLLEFFFLGGVYFYFSSRDISILELPASPTDRAVVGLVFLFFFSTRVVFYVLRKRYESDEEQGIG